MSKGKIQTQFWPQRMASAEVFEKKEYWGPVKGQTQADKQANSGQAANRSEKKQKKQQKRK